MAGLEFTEFRSPFQRELSKQCALINKSDKIFLMADKTNNIYKVSVDFYKKLLKDNITKDYRISDAHQEKLINDKAKDIATSLDIADRVEQYSDLNAFCTIKDHKDNFVTHPKCRLINPAKSQIGKISKQILQNMNSEIRSNLELNQWQSTKQTLEWFKRINQKSRKSFLQLDIEEFYPSITPKLLDDALTFAETIGGVTLTPQQKKIIHHSRQSLLFSTDRNGEKTTWQKKNALFDVTMGAPDGAEVCELVGLLLLYEMSQKFPDLNFGLYRDDGLGCHSRIPTNELKKLHRDIRALFAQHDLRITLEEPAKQVNFLDVTLNLVSESYGPYRKPNDTPLYVNTMSSHPPTVLKQIPRGINKRLSNISSNQEVFDDAKSVYQKALDDAGHNFELYKEPEPNVQTRRKQKRQIIYFNPPWNSALVTNIGKLFLKAVKDHFPPGHPLRPVMNRNTLKISYSTTRNMKAVFDAHNKKLLKQHTQEESRKSCSCQKKPECPLKGECLQENVVYQATVNNGNEQRKYVGSTVLFKTRYYAHSRSFVKEDKRHDTTLSEYIWDRGLGPQPNVKWEILSSAPAYNKGQKDCQLCLEEKYYILLAQKDRASLNKRTEMMAKCRHKNSFLLKNAR